MNLTKSSNQNALNFKKLIVMAADAVEAAIVTISHMTTQFMCLKCTNTDKYLEYLKFILENKFDIEKSLNRRAQGCGAAEKLMEKVRVMKKDS